MLKQLHPYRTGVRQPAVLSQGEVYVKACEVIPKLSTLKPLWADIIRLWGRGYTVSQIMREARCTASTICNAKTRGAQLLGLTKLTTGDRVAVIRTAFELAASGKYFEVNTELV